VTAPLRLPVEYPSAAAWYLAERVTVRAQTAAAAGVATLDLGQLDSSEQWLIERVVCSSTSTARTRLRLYESYPTPLNFLSGTDDGNFCEADYPTGLLVQPSRSLVAQWSGADAGAVCTLAVQVQIHRRG
jgi:hypothetical protein